MGTRSTIALEFADGTVQQVYCHWDGYLSHNGRILQEHYSDPFKLQRLIALGGISSLDREIGEVHPFDQGYSVRSDVRRAAILAAYNAAKDAGWTTFYARDRGEPASVQYYTDISDYYQHCQEEEYDYILRNVKGTATWFVRCNATDGFWVTIERATLLEKQGTTA